MICDENEVEEVLLLQPERSKNKGIFLGLEIMVFFVLFSEALTYSVSYNILLERTCIVDLGYNVTVCAQLHSANKSAEAKDLESVVEKKTSFIIMIMSVISGFMPGVLSMFLGSFSDKHGRKPLLIWPLFGLLVSSVLAVIFCAVSSLSAWWFVLTTLPFALLGGDTTVALGANLFVTDATSEDNRSYRLSLLQGFICLGLLIGTLSSSYLFKAVGFVRLFTFSASICVPTFLFAILFLEESLPNVTKGSLKDLINWECINQMMSTCFKERSRRASLIVWFLVTSYGVTMFAGNGNDNISYLFVRERFQWLLRDYNFYLATNMMITVFGIFFGMMVLQGFCKMGDGSILSWAYISLISNAVIKGFSNKSWQMYLASATSVLSALSSPLIRSQITKVVAKEDIGSMYSFLSCAEATLPVFAPLLYNTLYSCTLSTFPGAFYILSAIFYAVSMALVLSAQVLLYKMKTNNDSDAAVN